MRIVHVVALQRASGAAAVVIEVAKYLTEIGHEVAIVSSSKVDRGMEALIPNKVVVVPAPPIHTMSRSLEINDTVFSRILNQADVVHFHGVYSPVHFVLARACALRGIPYVVSPHGNLMREARRHRGLKKAMAIRTYVSKMIAEAQALHVLSPTEAQDVQEVSACGRVWIIPNGINIRSVPSGFRFVTRDRFVITFLGRLDVHHKGLDLFLDAVGLIADTLRQTAAQVRLVGPYQRASDMNQIERQCKRLAIEDVVTVAGPRYGPEKWAELSRASLFIHTSRYEGMPIAVLEAMAIGLPCIVTPGTNMGEIGSEGAGWLVDPRPARIAELLEHVVSLPRQELDAIGARAQELVASRFSWDRVMREYECFYRSLGEVRKPSGRGVELRGRWS